MKIKDIKKLSCHDLISQYRLISEKLAQLLEENKFKEHDQVVKTRSLFRLEILNRPEEIRTIMFALLNDESQNVVIGVVGDSWKVLPQETRDALIKIYNENSKIGFYAREHAAHQKSELPDVWEGVIIPKQFIQNNTAQ